MSDDGVETEVLYVEIPASYKKRMDAEPESLRDVTTKALREYLGTRDETMIDIEINRLEREKESLLQTRDEVDAGVKEKEERIKELKQKKEEMGSTEEQYRSDCEELLDRLQSGDIPNLVPVFCEDVAEKHGKDKMTVHEDCKRIAGEQDRDLRTVDFMGQSTDPNHPGESPFVGDVWGDDDE